MRRRIERLLRAQEARLWHRFDVEPYWLGPVRNKRWRVVMAIRALFGWELGGWRRAR